MYIKSRTGITEKNYNNEDFLERDGDWDVDTPHLECGLHKYIRLLKLMVYLGFMHFYCFQIVQSREL